MCCHKAVDDGKMAVIISDAMIAAWFYHDFSVIVKPQNGLRKREDVDRVK